MTNSMLTPAVAMNASVCRTHSGLVEINTVRGALHTIDKRTRSCEGD